MHCNLHMTQCDSSLSLPGAPELDILEAMPGKEVLEHTSTQKPYYSASLQISPGLLQLVIHVVLCKKGFVCCYDVLGMFLFHCCIPCLSRCTRAAQISSRCVVTCN
jgi:hypothetical protein